MYKFPKLPFYASVGAIPESYLISLSYEEQILWLCSQVQAIKEGTPNYNYELLENKPSINNIPLIGNLTPEQLGISNDYNIISNKPLINGVIVSGNKSGIDYGLQNQLIAGSGISIVGNTISATGGGGGGTTDYNELSNKPSLNLITIEGHKNNRDYGIQPQLQTNISSDLTLGYTYDISNLSVNDVILPYTSDTSEVKYSAIRQVTSNGACKILDVKNGERYYFRGVVQFLGIGEDNKVIIKWNNPDNIYAEDSEYTATENMTLLVSFFNISLQVSEPRILQVQMGKSIAESHLRNEKSTNEAKYDIEKLLLENAEYKSKTLNTGKYLDFDANRQLIEINQLNTSSILIDLSENPIYNKIKIKGKAIEHYMFLFADSTREVIKLCPQNLAYFDEYIYLDIPEEATYLAISFFDTNNFAPSLEVVEMADTKSAGNFYTIIDEDITLSADGTSSYNFENNKYYYLTRTHKITYVDSNNTSQTNWDFSDSIFYYYENVGTSTTKSLRRTGLTSDPVPVEEYELQWISSLNYWFINYIESNEFIKNTYYETQGICRTRNAIASTGNDYDVPTIEAVRNYVGSSGVFYTELNQDLYLNQDGTMTPNVASGYYYLKNKQVYYYDENGNTTGDINTYNSIVYVSNETNSKGVDLQGITPIPGTVYHSLSYYSSGQYWRLTANTTSNFIYNLTGNSSRLRTSIPASGQDNDVPTIDAVRSYVSSEIPTIATSITSSSTNSQVAGAKAVYDSTMHVYSTSERRIGTWINGKPLYEKTFTITDIPQVTTDGTSVDTKTNIGTNVNYAFIKNSFAVAGNTPLSNYQTLPYISNSGLQLKSQITNNSGNLAVDIISTGTAYNNYYMVVAVVNYTKSTD